MKIRTFSKGIYRLDVYSSSTISALPPSRIIEEEAGNMKAGELYGEGNEISDDEGIFRISDNPESFEFLSPENKVLVRGSGEKTDHSMSGIVISLNLPPEMICLGLGQKQGSLNKRGRKWLMHNTEPVGTGKNKDPLYQSHPFMLFLHEGAAFGLYLDSPAHTWFDVDCGYPGRLLIGSPGSAESFYFIAGPHPKQVLNKYTGLTGRTFLPPRWALGHHQSRWSYSSEKEVLRIAEEGEKLGIVDAIHLDIDYMDGFRVFTWNKKRFPDPEGMMSRLEKMGIKTVLILDPGLKLDRKYDHYMEGKREGHFLKRKDGSEYHGNVWPGTTAFPDFTREETRKWWAEKTASLLAFGASGIWNDMNEPAWWIPLPNLNLFRRRKMRPDDVVFHDNGRKTPFPDLHNLYAFYQAKAATDAFRKALPDKRPFILTRSGFSGIQKYAAMWTGDTSSGWNYLAADLLMLMNLSISGYAFTGTDIGGFSGNCNPELYARWIQAGSIFPFCRTHCMKGMRRQEAWSFGEKTRRAAVEAIRLRYRLLPYIVSLFRYAEETGIPVLRPLLLEFLDCPESIMCEDQAMLGPDLMAAPVMKKGEKKREVFFPEGDWYDFRSGRLFRGGGRHIADAPLEAGLPLFAREGAIIPMWPPGRRASDPLPDCASIKLFPSSGRINRFYWFDEKGDGYDYLKGDFCGIEYETGLLSGKNKDKGCNETENGNKIYLSARKREGKLPYPYKTLDIIIRLEEKPESVDIKGAKMEGYRFENSFLECRLNKPDEEWTLVVR